jgi:hypothetical protein
MATAEHLAPLPLGAPVVVVVGSFLLHHPSIYRLGRGSHHRPISSYFSNGTVPLHWTTMCGQAGTVVFFCDFLDDESDGVCPDCERLTVQLS